ncbi:hypothetical protein GZ77_01795 [Endozoicomonas montiporae]|uniref:Ppx/GppA phosphatase N-terminal domain-containing protein n=2 Tax=Endozoicomonas montiporae TaxID=1027273 RepID=A0A081NAD3_9GAMM|nr:hypothetical protein [Endozoicomonas montiporae]AMO56915.1 exopolyphosphatase [Endozoicomonas montiporae CL-33]KEQ15406.1 hypothetical protein GZ77_01795 [Endozoicomonas montiporae]
MKRALISLLLTFASFTATNLLARDSVERRLVIEVGSSAIKYAIADVNSSTDTILEIKDQDSIAFRLHDNVLNNDKRIIDSATLNAISDIFLRLKDKASYYHTRHIKVVATEAVRIASNRVEVESLLQGKTGFVMQVLSQDDEDRMDYFTALRVSKKPGKPIVWDIGNNSYQLIASDSEANSSGYNHLAYKGDYGSRSFFRYLLEVVQGKSLEENSNLHPLTRNEYKEALRFAHHLAERTPKMIQSQIARNNGEVVAIGSLFQYSLLEAIKAEPDQLQVTQNEVKRFIERALELEETEHHKDSKELQLNRLGFRQHEGFSHLTLSNAIMVYGFMQELGILSLTVADRTSTDSILEYSPFWQ